MQDELDKDLQFLFQEKSRNLPEEPFLDNMRKLVERRQFQRSLMQFTMLLSILLCGARFSPILIKYSIMLSGVLNAFFEAAGNAFSMPAGMAAAGLGALLVFIFKSRRIRHSNPYKFL
jgi:hypothetical protein